ncbi:hypothetical protein HAP94_25865 [Acidithiobacillus ferrivorans]|nr:hypothetical protein [Acidithiobacillus ferrivorans]
MNAVVKINVNEKALLSNLKMAFATGTTWVTELLQNARRAGATQIRIVLKPELKVLTIWDDGKGIADMQNLFSIAESGWDETILSEEKPYGMGFLSCLFACEKVQINSNKQQVSVVTKDAIAFDDIHVVPHQMVEGTFIRMEGVTNMPSLQFLKDAVKGFPVPVYLDNGPVYLDRAKEPLNHAHAVHALDWAQTEVGLVHIKSLCITFRSPTVYLQGLPIDAGFHSRFPDEHMVVHLDPTKFFGRLPDRASVIDPGKARVAIQSAIIKVYVERLHQKKLEMLAQGQAQEFVHSYGGACLAYCKSLLNDLPFLPGNVITGFVNDLDCNSNNHVVSHGPNHVSKQAVIDGAVKLFSGSCNGGYDHNNMAHMAFIDAQDGLLVATDGLDSEHWVHPYVHHLTGEVCISLSEQQAPFAIYGRFMAGKSVILGDALTLSGTFDVGGVPVEMKANYDGAVFDEDKCTFYVPSESNGFGIVCQASSYVEDDDYNEQAYGEDNTLFTRLVSEARNPDPSLLLQHILGDAGLDSYASIVGHSFIVSVTAEGNVSVTLTD